MLLKLFSQECDKRWGHLGGTSVSSCCKHVKRNKTNFKWQLLEIYHRTNMFAGYLIFKVRYLIVLNKKKRNFNKNKHLPITDIIYI